MSAAARGGAVQAVTEAAPDIEALRRRLADVDYISRPRLPTALFLSLRLPQPLLIERAAAGLAQAPDRQPVASSP